MFCIQPPESENRSPGTPLRTRRRRPLAHRVSVLKTPSESIFVAVTEGAVNRARFRTDLRCDRAAACSGNMAVREAVSGADDSSPDSSWRVSLPRLPTRLLVMEQAQRELASQLTELEGALRDGFRAMEGSMLEKYTLLLAFLRQHAPSWQSSDTTMRSAGAGAAVRRELEPPTHGDRRLSEGGGVKTATAMPDVGEAWKAGARWTIGGTGENDGQAVAVTPPRKPSRTPPLDRCLPGLVKLIKAEHRQAEVLTARVDRLERFLRVVMRALDAEIGRRTRTASVDVYAEPIATTTTTTTATTKTAVGSRAALPAKELLSRTVRRYQRELARLEIDAYPRRSH
eukprot:ctg_129.g83